MKSSAWRGEAFLKQGNGMGRITRRLTTGLSDWMGREREGPGMTRGRISGLGDWTAAATISEAGNAGG